MHVDSEDKTTLSEVNVSFTYTYNEGKAVYISEPGLYSLILKSKMQAANSHDMFLSIDGASYQNIFTNL